MDKNLREWAEREATRLYPNTNVTLARGCSYISGPSERASFVDGVGVGYDVCIGQLIDHCQKVAQYMQVNQISENTFEHRFSTEHQLTIKIKLQHEKEK